VDSHHRRGRLALLAATAIVAALVAVSGASAATTCTSEINSGSFQSIVVPPDAECVLNTQNGDVIEVAEGISVGQGAILGVFAAGDPCGQILIHGSVVATSPEIIVFEANLGCTLRVDGGITSSRASERVHLIRISVGGNVALLDNSGAAYIVGATASAAASRSETTSPTSTSSRATESAAPSPSRTTSPSRLHLTSSEPTRSAAASASRTTAPS
jgi:hypothetical protein